MKNIILTVLSFISLCCVIYAQKTELTPTTEDTKAAQELAAKFFNHYAETQDVTPLIGEFFIKDFETRLKFCETTGNCGGFARDFWGKSEELIQLKPSGADFRRQYCAAVNQFFLFFRIVEHIKIINPNDSDESENSAMVEIEKRLKDKPELLRSAFFSDHAEENVSSDNLNTISDFRYQLENMEELNLEMRKMELKLRNEAESKNSKAKFVFSSADFRIDIEENKGLFFEFPKGTKMFDVWGKSDNNSLPFKMDLINENGSLKIVAIYPPID